ncbi:guanylin-like [Saccopteryx bilineata]|uniref:guanylin-like n=1 Tax=Saccopteryx bilineata TaxID=59482 RepID=UPI00338E8E8F
MNTFLLAALCLLGTWADLTQGVTVPDEEFFFPLESVKKLTGFRELRELEEPSTERQRQFGWSLVYAFCAQPDFPEQLRALCKIIDAKEIYRRLEAIAKDLKIGVPKP